MNNIEDIINYQNTLFHLDATELDLVNNQRVTQWQDKSGNDRHAVNVGLDFRPQFKTNITNNLPAVQFSPIDAYEGQHLVIKNSGITSATSLFVVYYGFDKRYYDILGSWDSDYYIRNQQNVTQSNQGEGWIRHGNFQKGEWAVCSLFNNDGQYTLYQNSIPHHGGQISEDLNVPLIGIGRALGSIHNFSGYIGEIIAIDNVGEEEKQALEHYFLQKWGSVADNNPRNIQFNNRTTTSLTAIWDPPSNIVGGSYDTKLLEEKVENGRRHYTEVFETTTEKIEQDFPPYATDSIYTQWVDDGFDLYRVQLSSNPYFSSIISEKETTDTSHEFKDLNRDEVYYWRVQKTNYLGGIIEKWENHYFSPPTSPMESAEFYLNPATTYLFAVRHIVGSSISNWNYGYTSTRLVPPVNLISTQVFPHSFIAKWSEAPNAEEYEIEISRYFSEDDEEIYHSEGEIEGTEYKFEYDEDIFDTLMDHTGSFYWKIRARAGEETSDWSEAVGLEADRLLLRLDSSDTPIDMAQKEDLERWFNFSVIQPPIYLLQTDKRFKPRFVSNALNGESVVEFKGKKFLESEWYPKAEEENLDGENEEDLAKTGMTLMVMVNLTRSANQCILDAGSIYIGTDDSGNLQTRFGDGQTSFDDGVEPAGRVPVDEWIIITLRFNNLHGGQISPEIVLPGEVEAFINGELQHSYPAAFDQTFEPFKLGSAEQDIDFLAAEVMFFQRMLSDIELAAVEMSWKEKWLDWNYLKKPQQIRLTGFDEDTFTVEWDKVTGATEYDIILAERVLIEKTEFEGSGEEAELGDTVSFYFFETIDRFTANNEYQQFTDIPPSTNIYCLVRAKGDESYSPWKTFNFISPSYPPDDLWNSSVGFFRFRCNWSPVENATKYKVQLSGDEEFSDIMAEVDINPDDMDNILESDVPTSHLFTGLEIETTYYWRVKAFTMVGDTFDTLSYTKIAGEGSSQETEWVSHEVTTNEKPSIFLHLDASDPKSIPSQISLDTNILAWEDLSGNTHHAYQTSPHRRPKLVLDSRLGNRCVQFDNDSFMVIPSWQLSEDDFDVVGEDSVGMSLFAAVKLNARRNQNLFGVWDQPSFFLRSTTKGYLHTNFGKISGFGREDPEESIPYLLLDHHKAPEFMYDSYESGEYTPEWFLVEMHFSGTKDENDNISGEISAAIYAPADVGTDSPLIESQSEFSGQNHSGFMLGGIADAFNNIDAEIGEVMVFNFNLSMVPGSEFNPSQIRGRLADKWFRLQENLTGVYTDNVVNDGFTIHWNPLIYAEEILLQIDIEPDFLEPHQIITDDASLDHRQVSSLERGTRYYWRLQGTTTSYGPTNPEFGEVYTPLADTEDTSIVDLEDIALTASWESVENADYYTVELYKDGSLERTVEYITNNYYVFDGLDPVTEYYFRVKASSELYPDSGFVNSDPATTFDLPKLNDIDDAFAENESLIGFDLRWTAVGSAEKYIIEIYDDSEFNNLVDTVEVDFEEITTTTTESTTTTAEPTTTTTSEFGNYLKYQIDSLNIDTAYWWKVKAQADYFRDSEWFEGDVHTATGIPQSLINTDIQCLSFIANWDEVIHASHYYVELSEDSDFETIALSESTSNNYYLFNNLNFNTTYYWRVKASFSFTGDSNWNQLSAQTNEQPKPSRLRNSNLTYNAFTAKWNSMENVDEFTIELSKYPNFDVIVSSNTVATESFDFTNLDFNTRYYWRIVGTHNICGETKISYFMADTPHIVPSFTANRNIHPNSFRGIWGSVPGADYYDIEISEDINFETGVDSFTTSETYFNFTGLDHTTVYYWRVRTVLPDIDPSDWTKNSVETASEWLIDYPENIHIQLGGVWTGEVSTTTTNEPSTTTTTESTTTTTITNEDSINPLDAWDNLEIHRIAGTSIWSEDGTDVANDESNRLKLVVEYITNTSVSESIYCSKNNAWIEGGSINDTITTDHYYDGLEFRSLWNGYDENNITQNWDTLFNEGFINSADVNYYRDIFFEFGVTGWQLVADINDPEYLDGPLEEGIYHYRVKAVNTLGNESLPSNEKSFTIKTAPLPPSGINYELIENYSQLMITFTGSESVDVSHYNIYCSGDKDYINISSTTDIIASIDHQGNVEHTFVFDEFSSGHNYMFLVRAVDFHGNEEANINQSFIVRYDEVQEKAGRQPAQAHNIQVNALEGGRAQVSWLYDPSEEPNLVSGAAHHAKVYYRSSDETTTTGEEYGALWWKLELNRPSIQSEFSTSYQIIDLTELEDGIYSMELLLVIYSEEDGGLYWADNAWREVEFEVDTPDAPQLTGHVK